MATVGTPPKSLPEILPVFPLTGVLLLPGMALPLHVFEPRYRNLVEDTLKAEGVFGMIQPFVPQQDNQPLPGAEKETPELYKVGCAGYIERSAKLPDGRYTIQLKGLHRFRIEKEMPLLRGYRRVKAAYKDFPDATEEQNWRCNRAALVQTLQEYAQTHGLQIQMDRLDRFADMELINLLGASLPFQPAEKQALLEAPSLREREAVLLELLGFAISGMPPQTVN
jgi:Lon protease-like protein